MDRLTFDFYFGTTPSPPLVASDLLSPKWDPPGDLEEGTSYYWRVVVRDMWGIETAGPLWKFTTFLPTPFSVLIRDMLGLEHGICMMLSDFEHFIPPELYQAGTPVKTYPAHFKTSSGECTWSGLPFEYYFHWWFENYLANKSTDLFERFSEIDITQYINSHHTVLADTFIGNNITLPVYDKTYHPFHPFVLKGTSDNDYCPDNNTVLALEGDTVVEYKVSHHLFKTYTLSDVLITDGEEISLDTSLFRTENRNPDGSYTVRVSFLNVSPVQRSLYGTTISIVLDSNNPLASTTFLGWSDTTCTNSALAFGNVVPVGESFDFYIKVTIPDSLDGAFNIQFSVNYGVE